MYGRFALNVTRARAELLRLTTRPCDFPAAGFTGAISLGGAVRPGRRHVVAKGDDGQHHHRRSASMTMYPASWVTRNTEVVENLVRWENDFFDRVPVTHPYIQERFVTDDAIFPGSRWRSLARPFPVYAVPDGAVRTADALCCLVDERDGSDRRRTE